MALATKGPLTPWEVENLKQFFKFWDERQCGPVQLPCGLDQRLSVPLYYVGLDHSSHLYRTAILVLMSYLQNNNCELHTLEYLDKFYREAKRCIDSGSILELLCASYIVAVYSLLYLPHIKPLDVIGHHRISVALLHNLV